MSHTPVPWKWKRNQGKGMPTLLVGGPTQVIILDDACCNPQDEALIEAAPDLLAACKTALSELAAIGQALGELTQPETVDVMNTLEAVISKVEGKK